MATATAIIEMPTEEIGCHAIAKELPRFTECSSLSSYVHSDTATENSSIFWSICKYLGQMAPMTPPAEVSTTPDVRSDEELFAKALGSFAEPADIQRGMVTVFDKLSLLLPRGKFKECDAILSSVDPQAVSLRIMIALLKGTSRVPEDELPSRPSVLQCVTDRIRKERSPEDATSLLQRLR